MTNSWNDNLMNWWSINKESTYITAWWVHTPEATLPGASFTESDINGYSFSACVILFAKNCCSWRYCIYQIKHKAFRKLEEFRPQGSSQNTWDHTSVLAELLSKHKYWPMNQEWADEFLCPSGVVTLTRNSWSLLTVKFLNTTTFAGHGLRVWPSSCSWNN